MWFKRCPRCGGDVYLRDTIESKELICIQCSHTLEQSHKLMEKLTQGANKKRKLAS